ncbi:FixH family protein [Paenibacillus puerhi]|uniref:FixH family protein n=1 Tax=Paenibacillus puerhi TaxID=2692622 RepID=UPI00135A42D8|nr:FixH family protein [Paenibacillus puerhi]
MKRIGIVVSLTLCFLLAMTACSSGEQGQDPASVKVEMTTEPAAPVAASEVDLIAKLTGLVKADGAKVQFDIRSENKNALPDVVTAESQGNGAYSVKKTFDKPGVYTIYIHVYQGDLHITKKKEVTVTS